MFQFHSVRFLTKPPDFYSNQAVYNIAHTNHLPNTYGLALKPRKITYTNLNTARILYTMFDLMRVKCINYLSF